MLSAGGLAERTSRAAEGEIRVRHSVPKPYKQARRSTVRRTFFTAKSAKSCKSPSAGDEKYSSALVDVRCKRRLTAESGKLRGEESPKGSSANVWMCAIACVFTTSSSLFRPATKRTALLSASHNRRATPVYCTRTTTICRIETNGKLPRWHQYT